MSGRGWYLEQGEGRALLARRWPARFDVAATTRLPPMRLVPLVHMVRQDIWRALRRLRGFAPVVEAWEVEAGVKLRAGGQVQDRVAHSVAEQVLVSVLDNSDNRARWLRCAC